MLFRSSVREVVGEDAAIQGLRPRPVAGCAGAVEARAPRHLHPALSGVCRRDTQKGGLPDAGLARHEHHRGPLIDHAVDRGAQTLDLPVSTDQVLG